MTTAERGDIQQKISSWLVEENYGVKVQENPNVYFVINAQHPTGIGLAIGQEVGKKDRLVISASLNLDEDAQKRLRSLPEKERQDILWDIRFGLIALDVQFQMIPNGNMPTVIQVSKLLYYDGVTKDRFMGLVQKVTDSLLLVVWKLQRKFGASAPKEEQMYG